MFFLDPIIKQLVINGHKEDITNAELDLISKQLDTIIKLLTPPPIAASFKMSVKPLP